MEYIYLLILFIIGIICGWLFDKIGRKLPKNKKIFTRERCNNCGYYFPLYERIPFISYFISSGRCNMCRCRLDSLEVVNELFTGLLFSFSYYVFGYSLDMFIALGIVALLMIIVVSDLTYYVILDEVLVTLNIYFIVILLFKVGLVGTSMHIISGTFIFSLMYLIMLTGNLIFKKESLGGGDIKMMFTSGLLLGPVVGVFSIFIGSFLALPVSLIIMKLKGDKIIPFGPFLLVALLILYFMKIDTATIYNLFNF